MTSLKDLAIHKALEGNWEDAILANQQLLEENPTDLDSMNRLAYAYLQSGQYDKAGSVYQQVILQDKTNPIALKNIKKLETLSTQTGDTKPNTAIHTNHTMDNAFIQEAGKTKTVDLSNIADKKTLTYLQYGDEATLIIKRSKIFVLTTDKKYIGMLPDSVGIRLVSFIKGGNEYLVNIKSVDNKKVTIFIKEAKRAKKFFNQPSFT